MRGENGEAAEERVGPSFFIRGRNFQVLRHHRFHFVQSPRRREFSQVFEEQFVSLLALDHLHAIEDLAVRSALPDGEDHGFAEPALDAKFGKRAQAAVDFHGPFGGVHGEFGGPVFCQVRDEAEQMIAIGVRRALHPDFVEKFDGFPGERKARAQGLQARFKLLAKQRVINDPLAVLKAMSDDELLALFT